MRTILLLFVICTLACSSSASSPTVSEIIEQTIFWKAERDSRWVPIEMNKLVSNPDLFAQEGNFYKPKSKIEIFGHELVYAGILGVDLCPGPNVTLKGKIRNVRDMIQKRHKLMIKEVDGGFVADLDKDTKLLIFPHPDKSGQTIVIGAYLGP